MFAQPPLAAGPDPVHARTADSARQRWLLACAHRLAQLRPRHDSQVIEALALDLLSDVGSYDPEIAAEMEHEAWPFDD